MKLIYVALLRGINVGGKNKIDMKLLKQGFESIGLTDVQTYINSGNIVFSSSLSHKKLSSNIHNMITAKFDLQIPVLIRSFNQYRKVMDVLPKNWTNDKTMKSDCMFLWEEIDSNSILDQLTIKPGIDTVKYVSGSLLWSVARENVTRSGLMYLAKSKLYKKMTVRNVNTTRKLYELMSSISL